MTLALSTVWSGKNSEDGHQIVAEAKELGFDSIELHHSLKATTVKQILGEQKRNNVQVTSLHCLSWPGSGQHHSCQPCTDQRHEDSLDANPHPVNE